MNEITTNILEACADSFKTARRAWFDGARLLYQIKKENLWNVNFESFSGYLNSECQISDSFASKLLQVYEYYVLEARFQPQQIEGVDSEKLYLALRLSGDDELRLEKARSLTRAELMAEVREGKHGICDCNQHPQITICSSCRSRV